MKEKIRHIISVALAVLFLAPSGVKLADVFFHEHNEIHCFAKDVQHFHEHDVESCDIVGVQYSTFISNSPLFITEKPSVKNSIYSNLYISYKEYNKKNYFSLRAPPVLVS